MEDYVSEIPTVPKTPRDRSPKTVEHTCTDCGQRFTGTDRQRKPIRCAACRAKQPRRQIDGAALAAKRTRKERNCARCGAAFTAIGPRLYCSDRCKNAVNQATFYHRHRAAAARKIVEAPLVEAPS